MKRILYVSALILPFILLAILPVHAQIHNERTPRLAVGIGYTGLSTLHGDTTVTYPLGFYADLSRRVGSTLIVTSVTHHTKNKDGITTNFTGFLVGAAAVMSFGDALISIYASPQIGLERTGVSGTISLPGSDDIRLDEASTGLAYQIEGGFLVPVRPAAHLKLSGTLRGASYDPDSGPYNTAAFFWSVGFMLAP